MTVISPLAPNRAELAEPAEPAESPGSAGPARNRFGRATARGANAPRPADAPRRDEDELRALGAAGAAELGDDPPAAEVIAWAARTFPGTLAVACSMADAVLPHVVAAQVPGVDTLFLQTGFHFAETEGTRDAVAATMDVTIVDVLPALSVAEQDERFGPRLYARDPGACCRLRKVEPLARALAGYEVWATGVRREDALTRTAAPLVSFDQTHRIVKINPLAAWTFEELLAYAAEHDVIINPLLADGYPSIGCAPCTARVAPGEDPRSGRWAGFTKTECGIHL